MEEQNKELQEQEPVFVPAQPGEKVPDEVPQQFRFNRKQRRALAKAGKRNDEATLRQLFPSGKELLKNPEFRKSLYKDLYEDFIVRKDKYKEKIENDSTEENGTSEN